MKTCYCGHPKSSHCYLATDREGFVETTGCAHCVCKQYIEQSKKEQASEEDSCPGCGTRTDIHEVDCRIGRAKWIAKPQEEPKCCDSCRPGGAERDGVEVCQNTSCFCHQKESESREDAYTKQLAVDFYANHIVLEKPKGMSIGAAIQDFEMWCEDQHDFGLRDDFRMPDPDFLKLWQEWLNTFPLSDRKSTDNNVGNCGIKNCKLSSVHAHVLYL